jgi:Domain of unknown function (DUF4383)
MTATRFTGARHRTPVQVAAAAVGVLFLLIGVLGFVPGITTNYDTLSWSGHHSGAMLFGLFAVSVLHNLVHVAFGVAGVLMGRTLSGARIYLIGGGLVYAVLWLYGILIDLGSDMNFMPLNRADNWLDLGLAIGMAVLGVALGGTRQTPSSDSIQSREK